MKRQKNRKIIKRTKKKPLILKEQTKIAKIKNSESKKAKNPKKINRRNE